MRTLRVYRSYNFIDKDPVLSAVQTLVEDSGESYQKIHEISDVSTSTLHNWFWCQTKRPQHATICAVVYALGGQLKIVDNHGVEIKPPRGIRPRRRRKKNGR